MADVKWIKLTSDLFDNRKIKQIRKMPDGDALIVIWFQILCLAGNQGSKGLVFFSEDIPYNDEMLSVEFDRNINTIRLALNTFIKFGMIEIVNEFILVSNWEKYQSADKIESIREYNREKKRDQRERQKLLALKINEKDVNDSQGHVLGSQDIDIYLPSTSNSLVLNDIYKDVIDYLNLKAGKNFKLVESNKKHINARIKEGFTLDDFKKVIDNKVTEWKNDDKMNQYLRPETLFSSKFQSYLNSEPKQNLNGKRKENVTVYPTQEVEDVDYDQIAQQFANLSGL